MNAQQKGLERSLRVRPTSTTTVIVVVAKVERRLCGSVSLGSTNDCVQSAWLSRSVTRLSASDPTSAICLARCSKSCSDRPSSTPPSLYLESRCCAHRLNQQRKAVPSQFSATMTATDPLRSLALELAVVYSSSKSQNRCSFLNAAKVGSLVKYAPRKCVGNATSFAIVSRASSISPNMA